MDYLYTHAPAHNFPGWAWLTLIIEWLLISQSIKKGHLHYVTSSD